MGYKARARRWTQEEDEIVKKMWGNSTREEKLKALPGRTLHAIQLRANLVLDLTTNCRGSGQKWTKKEDDLLKEQYPIYESVEELEKLFSDRSLCAIRQRARHLGISGKRARKTSPIASDKLPPKDPEVEVSERMRQLFGTEVLKPSKLPKMRAARPFNMLSKSGEIMVINSPLIGSLSTDDDKTDIVRNSLRLAEASGCDAVVITGNLMFMLTQRYGTQRPYKTQISGIVVDPKKVEEQYPRSVVQDPKFESIEKRRQKGEPIFVTLRLRLEHNIEMLRRTFIDGNGKPLFSGTIYLTFGKLEDELVMFYVNELLRIGLFKTRAWAQKRMLEHQGEWRSEKDPKKKEELHQKVKDFKEFLSIFATLSNVADESVEKAREIVTGYVIKKYEENIPNAKVVSVGDAFLKTDTRIIMITTDKHKQFSRGNLGDVLVEKTESFAKGRSHISIPDVMLGTGLNPFFDQRWITYQASNEKDDKRMCPIIQLPMCIDSARYRDVIRDQNILKDLISKVGRESGFESGVITLRWYANVAQPVVSFWGSDLLKSADNFKDESSIRALVGGQEVKHKLIYGHKKGCTHYGANDILLHHCPSDRKRPVKFHYQVVMEFLLAANAPIAMDQHDGDITQGANHPYWKNTHPQGMLPEDMLDEMNAVNGLRISDEEKIHRLIKIGFTQRIYSAVFQPDDQMRGYVLSLKSYLEYFIRIIALKKRTGLKFEGRLSTIMHIMGNHNTNTYKASNIFISDALHVSEQLKKLLIGYLSEHPIGGVTKDDIENELSAPQHGPLGEGRGSVGIGGQQQYAMILKHKQGKMKATDREARRRSANELEAGLPIINLSGDDHKGALRITRGVINIKTGCHQGEGSYGREIGGSEQNVFSMIFGIPVGGLTAGPLVFLALDIETMRRFAAKPFSVDGDKLFRNALK
ncbi:MAG: hypothetical protein Q8Q37_01795 [bacterium]|nr:hypothetical protein [bacterium]